MMDLAVKIYIIEPYETLEDVNKGFITAIWIHLPFYYTN